MNTITIMGRYSQAALFSGFITLSLFFLMQMLVAENQKLILDETGYRTVIITQVKRVDPSIPPEPPVNDDVDAPILDPITDVIFPKGPGVIETDWKITPDPGGPSTLGGSGQLLAIVKVTPVYPVRPLQDNIEGTVVLEFTVDAGGKVRDIIIRDEFPKGYGFAKAAVKAAEKFKYHPRKVNGRAVDTVGILEKFEFRLEDEK